LSERRASGYFGHRQATDLIPGKISLRVSHERN
jgi:hypothetical protein